MGNLPSRDTRRISFDNTFAMNSALTIPKSIEDDADVLNINSLEANKINDSKEIGSRAFEIHDNEHDYWAHRIEYLKNEHQLINKIIETEYEKTIENTKKLFNPPKITQERIQRIKPCYDWRTKIMKCYEDNPRQPLLCSTTVQAFNNCVTSCQLEE
ncbi:MICOS complex subunit MIC25-like [Colias croceus]|uniref:MICOS complex subunit MIC25-like n=1 Tax=Colias crocea TaxID=72248 RepID=UPI001E27F96E|nr:MICOS complex subunit MIC25-like [Colias croceus]